MKLILDELEPKLLCLLELFNIADFVDNFKALYFPTFVLHLEEGYRIVADIAAVDFDKHFDCRTFSTKVNLIFIFPCAGQNARGNGRRVWGGESDL